MESADRESRRLDILSVKKEANLSAREVGEVEVGACMQSWQLGYANTVTTILGHKKQTDRRRFDRRMRYESADCQTLLALSTRV